jgi:hypothetical protein
LVAVAPEPVDAEALGEAAELAEDEFVAELDGEAEDDAVALEPCDALELEDADEPSPTLPCVVSVTVVVVVVDGAVDEPALRTGAPASMPTTIEMLKTATTAAAMPIGFRYFRKRARRVRLFSSGGEITFVSSPTTRVSAVAPLGVHSLAVVAASVP